MVVFNNSLGLVLLLFVITSFCNCIGNCTFNSEKWKNVNHEDLITDVRECMLEDLLANYLKTGMSVSEVYNLLGEERLKDEMVVEYAIREKYEWDVDPVYIKYMVVRFDKHMKVIDYYVEQSH